MRSPLSLRYTKPRKWWFTSKWKPMKLLAGLVLTATLACAQETKTPEYKTRSDLVFLPTLVHKPNGDVVYGLEAGSVRGRG